MNNIQEHRYNIVLAGKTGVGKSALINYIYGQPIREVGTGFPVTKTGFHPTNVDFDGLKARIFDTWGIEAGKVDDWQETLEKELGARGVDKSPEHWFHAIFYCISAGSSRIESVEIEFIRQFIESDYEVIVVLTKADQATQEDIEILQNIVKNELGEKIPVIPVCSETKVLMGVGKVEPFGKGQILEHIVQHFFSTIVRRLPGRITELIRQEIEQWGEATWEEMLELLDNNPLMEIPDHDSLSISIESSRDEFVDELQERKFKELLKTELERTAAMYEKNIEYLAFNNLDINGSLQVEFPYLGELTTLEKAVTIAGIVLFPVVFPAAIIYGIATDRKKKKEYVSRLIEQAQDDMLQAVAEGEVESKIREILNEAVVKSRVQLPA